MKSFARLVRTLLPVVVVLGSACAGGGISNRRDDKGHIWRPGRYLIEGQYAVRVDTETNRATDRHRYRAEVTVTEDEQWVELSTEGACVPIETRGRYLEGPRRSAGFICGQSVLTISPDVRLIRASVSITVTDQIQETAGCAVYSEDGETCVRPEIVAALFKGTRSPKLRVRRLGDARD